MSIALTCPQAQENVPITRPYGRFYVSPDDHRFDHLQIQTDCGAGFVFWTQADSDLTLACMLAGCHVITVELEAYIRDMFFYHEGLRLPAAEEHQLQSQLRHISLGFRKAWKVLRKQERERQRKQAALERLEGGDLLERIEQLLDSGSIDQGVPWPSAN